MVILSETGITLGNAGLFILYIKTVDFIVITIYNYIRNQVRDLQTLKDYPCSRLLHLPLFNYLTKGAGRMKLLRKGCADEFARYGQCMHDINVHIRLSQSNKKS